MKNGKWFRCEYEVKEITIPHIPEHTIKVIAAKDSSPIERYSPIDCGKKQKNDEDFFDFEIRKYQPIKISGKDEWPPHWALLRLDLTEVKEIIEFASNYGLLGLWLAPSPKTHVWSSGGCAHPISGKYIDFESIDFIELFQRSDLNNGGGDRQYFEPIESFRKAAEEFQEACNALIAIQNEQPQYEGELFFKFESISKYYLKAISPLIVPNDETGLPEILWNFPNLLSFCYFRVLQDIGGGKLKECKYKKCNRLFQNNHTEYCSQACRHADTTNNLANRAVKRTLREMQQRGEIPKELRWIGCAKVDELYNAGLKNEDLLKSEVIKFIEKKKEEGNNGR